MLDQCIFWFSVLAPCFTIDVGSVNRIFKLPPQNRQQLSDNTDPEKRIYFWTSRGGQYILSLDSCPFLDWYLFQSKHKLTEKSCRDPDIHFQCVWWKHIITKKQLPSKQLLSCFFSTWNVEGLLSGLMRRWPLRCCVKNLDEEAQKIMSHVVVVPLPISVQAHCMLFHRPSCKDQTRFKKSLRTINLLFQWLKKAVSTN